MGAVVLGEYHLNLRLNSAPYQIATSVKDDKKIIKSGFNSLGPLYTLCTSVDVWSCSFV